MKELQELQGVVKNMQNGQYQIVIRKATEADVRQIAEILVEDWKRAYNGIMDSAYLDAMSVEQRYPIELRRYQKYMGCYRWSGDPGLRME